jgi:hypothetical protein
LKVNVVTLLERREQEERKVSFDHKLGVTKKLDKLKLSEQQERLLPSFYTLMRLDRTGR